MPAGRTGPAGVARIDHDDRDSRILRLVGDEPPELVERPAREPVASVPTPSRYPAADAFEVFEGNPASGVFGGLDDRLADDVVLVLAEPGFLPGHATKLLLRPLGPPSLESLPLEIVLPADRLDGLSAVSFGLVAGGRDPGD